MTINADDFIFNSNFLYNNPYKYGSTVITGTGTTVVATGISDNDRFKLSLDYSGTVYGYGGPFPVMRYWVDNGDLKCFSLVSSGTLYYRIYNSDEDIIFNSSNSIDKVVFSTTGSVDMEGSIGKPICSNTYGGKMILFAVWRNVTEAPDIWFADGQGNETSGTVGLNHDIDNIYLTYGGLESYSTIEYKIVGIKISGNLEDNFIFRSNEVLLSVPFWTTKNITSSTSLGASETKITYSDWYDTINGTLALDSYVQIGNLISPHWYQEYSLGTGISMDIETESNSDNQVRIKMTETNYNASPVSYDAVTSTVKFYMHHIAL